MGPGAQLSHIEAAIDAIERRLGDGADPAAAGRVRAELVRLYQQRQVAGRDLMLAMVEPEDTRTAAAQLPTASKLPSPLPTRDAAPDPAGRRGAPPTLPSRVTPATGRVKGGQPGITRDFG
jgi:hypothetical protein